MKKGSYLLHIHNTKKIILLTLLFSPLFNQIRLSFDHADLSNISISVDQVLHKQDNVKLGVGTEFMSQRLDKGFIEDKFSFNSMYMFMRFAYEKKWSSYLRIGVNSFSYDNDNLNGMMIGFGASYKLNDNWYVNSGYHLYSAKEYNYSSIVYSISRYFKASDED